MAVRYERNGRFFKFYSSDIDASGGAQKFPAAMANDLMDHNAIIDCEGAQEIHLHAYSSILLATSQASLLVYWNTPIVQSQVPSRVAIDWLTDAASANLAAAVNTSGTWKQELHKVYLRYSASTPIRGRYLYPSISVAASTQDVLVEVELRY